MNPEKILQNQPLLKTFVFVVWPFLSVFLLLFMAVIMLAAWVVIPFGTFVEDEEGNWKMRFK